MSMKIITVRYCCNETYNGTSITFEVHGHSDQGDGHDWVED